LSYGLSDEYLEQVELGRQNLIKWKPRAEGWEMCVNELLEHDVPALLNEIQRLRSELYNANYYG
jgi:hypothetical protein